MSLPVRRTRFAVLIILVTILSFLTGCQTEKSGDGATYVVLEGDSTTHFLNSPQYVNPDPNYVPGDYPLAEVANARAVYHTLKQGLENAVHDEQSAVTVNAGEVAWTSIKDSTKPVLGYFRNYFGVLKWSKKGIENAEIVIDVNSLDSAVPGRNNRILNIFFESMKPEFGAAELKLTKFDLDEKGMRMLEAGTSQNVTATGTLSLNGVTNEASVLLKLSKKGRTWFVETVGPLTILITDHGFGGRVFALMKECNHRSLANAVRVSAKLIFR
jgi:hypothetical protein